MAGTITAANSSFVLGVATVFPVAQIIQGYATDDAFTTEASDNAEVRIGVDGRISAGWVPYLTPMVIHLQADSPSADIFDAWIAAEDAARDKFAAIATIILPGPGKKYALTKGFLRRLVKIPSARKVLEPRDFTIEWGNIFVSPAS